MVQRDTTIKNIQLSTQIENAKRNVLIEKMFSASERLDLCSMNFPFNVCTCVIISPAHPRRCLINNQLMKFSYEWSSNRFNVFPASKAKRKLNPAKKFRILRRHKTQ